VPTNHPRLPADLSQLWLAPAKGRARTAAMKQFADAVKFEVDANYAKALPIFSQPSQQQGPLGHYAAFYAGLAQLRLGQAAEARDTFRALLAHEPVGYLAEAAAVKEAESDEALGDQAAAIEIYERLSKMKTTAPDDVLMRLAKAARAAGDAEKASTAFARVYYEFPLSDLSPLASAEIESLPNVQPIAPGNARYKLEFGRAERLFGSKRYAQARTAFEGLNGAAHGDEREVVNLRLAECDYFLKRPRNTRDEARPYIEHASRQAEALFFYAIATRDLGDHAEYLKTIRRIVDQFPTQSWAEEALNNLATHQILQSEDDQADVTFRELYDKYPTGRYAERAAWKIGWAAYKAGRYADTTRVFEKAAFDFPRSDFRPPWLYWSARAHEALKEHALAEARYTLAATDYLNSYYGRLAVKHLAAAPHRRLVVDTSASSQDDGELVPAALPPNQQVVRALLSLELYDQAIDELHYAQRVWGDSPAIQATFGWIYNQRGDLRAGINAMKRAYPQFLAAGGEKLPTEILRVLFPINYWPEIRRYAAERHLDPYLMAALIAQESTFTADVRSSANAYGLMQLLPSTGRQYAKSLHLRRFSMKMLTTADTNLKMGTAHFADLVRLLGATHYALASYNAGESRVVKWIADRPGVEREEFIDDIPFPETQNYVKRILGTAEDYRRLYGPESGRVAADETDATPAVARRGTPAKPAAQATAKKKPSTSHKAPAKKKKTTRRTTRKAA
jgi:soluble lytic murein transglycosylase